MKIVVGLGNPGIEYRNTRHNFGFMFLEYLEKKHGFSINKNKFESMYVEFTLNSKKVVFVKPNTYMNLSGNAVRKVKEWYKVESEDIIVVFDDIDVKFGEAKFRANGSGGTHNGMKNIVQVLGTTEIPRIKLGIGDIKEEERDLANFVLGKFSKEEEAKINDIFVQTERKLIDFLDK